MFRRAFEESSLKRLCMMVCVAHREAGKEECRRPRPVTATWTEHQLQETNGCLLEAVASGSKNHSATGMERPGEITLPSLFAHQLVSCECGPLAESSVRPSNRARELMDTVHSSWLPRVGAGWGREVLAGQRLREKI